MREALTYADVLIEPYYSDINSRDEIDIESVYLGDKRVPIISAPMDTVSGPEMVAEMSKVNAYGFLHRFQNTILLRTDDVFKTKYFTDKDFGISVGIKDENAEIEWLKQFGGIGIHTVLIDVAHGHHQRVAGMIKRIKYELAANAMDVPYVVAGNVATGVGFEFLARAGADAIRVGIGGGSACTTRGNTGVGMPQLTAILDCVRAQSYYPVPIIADGGIQSPGDIVKALAAGAEAVMLGRLIAGADETSGAKSSTLSQYRGQSSIGINGERKAPEGVEGWVNKTGPIKGTIESLSNYIKSGMSYVGARNLQELRDRAIFIKVSAATAAESGVRI